MFDRQAARTAAFALLLTFVIALVIVGWVWATAKEDTRDRLRLSVAEHALQLSVVVILGGGVAYLYKSAEDRRKETREAEEKKQEQARVDQRKQAERVALEADLRRETRTDYLKRLGASYREAKAIRRTLTAAGLKSSKDQYAGNEAPILVISRPQAESYTREMQKLEGVQLELEALMIEAGSLPAFASLQQLPAHLRCMEKYLRKILDEYEDYCPSLDSSTQLSLKELERLDEFTGSTSRIFKFRKGDPLRFDGCFSEKYESAIKLISQQLVPLTILDQPNENPKRPRIDCKQCSQSGSLDTMISVAEQQNT